MQRLVFFAMVISHSQAVLAPQPDMSPAARLAELEAIGRYVADSPCRKPLSVKRKLVVNIHDPELKDEIVESTCRGLSAHVYLANFTNPPRHFALMLNLMGPDPRIPPVFAVHASVADIQKTLGQPSAAKNDVIRYELDALTPWPKSISFTHRDGKVQSIRWVWTL